MPRQLNTRVRKAVLAILAGGERLTTVEIAERIGSAVNTAAHYTRALCKENRIHRAEYRLYRYGWQVIWAHGPGDGRKPQKVRPREDDLPAVPALCEIVGAVVRPHAPPKWAVRQVLGVFHLDDEGAA